MPEKEAFIGLMSGTSMDGIDAVLIQLSDSARPRILATHSHPWPAETLQRLQAAARGVPLKAAALAALDTEVGEILAEGAMRVAAASGEPVVAIGSHGQTLAHAPEGAHPATLQIGNPAVIAERSGITTVADFRRRDIAAGGQGAPLVPAFHEAVFRSSECDRAVVNVGGIANVTLLPADPAQPVTGFDSGPGNCLMDAWARKQLGEPYDRAGRFAAAGRPDEALLSRLLADPYFSAPPPKSTGTDYFSPDWLKRQLPKPPPAAADVQATLSALTAQSIARAIEQALPGSKEVLVCGGGAHNPVLMAMLEEALQRQVRSTAALGMDPEWVEAAAFAWLAQRTLVGLPGNLPEVTGARGPRILGAIYPA